MSTKTSLKHRNNPLHLPSRQLEILTAQPGHATFDEKLLEAGQLPLRADRVEILQVNLGKLCNMTCR